MAAISAPEATVIVGGFVLIGTIVQASVSARATRKTIGKPNGQGNVIEMLENLLVRQATISTAVTMLANRHHELVAEVDEVKTTMHEHHEKLLEHMKDTKRKKPPVSKNHPSNGPKGK